MNSAQFKFNTKGTFTFPNPFWNRFEVIYTKSLHPGHCGDIGDVREVRMIGLLYETNNRFKFQNNTPKNHLIFMI